MRGGADYPDPGAHLAYGKWPMVSGWDKHGPEYTPLRHPRTPRERLLTWLVFLAAIVAGASLAWLAK